MPRRLDVVVMREACPCCRDLGGGASPLGLIFEVGSARIGK